MCTPTQMCAATAVEELDRLGGGDPEAAHGAADEILLMHVEPEVREAYKRLMERSDWWAFA